MLSKNNEVYLNQDYYSEFLTQLRRFEITKINDVDDVFIDIYKNSLNSNIVISLFLEKVSDNNLNSKIYSQFDFVELASSQYGLPKETNDPEIGDGSIYKDINETFNAIYNNIVSSGINLTPRYDNTLTIALRPTLNGEANINFITCLLPYEISSYGDSNNAMKVGFNNNYNLS